MEKVVPMPTSVTQQIPAVVDREIHVDGNPGVDVGCGNRK